MVDKYSQIPTFPLSNVLKLQEDKDSLVDFKIDLDNFIAYILDLN